jgi:methionyl-tRNA formyltransferase
MTLQGCLRRNLRVVPAGQVTRIGWTLLRRSFSPRLRALAVRRVARRHRVPILETGDVNDPAYVEQVGRLRPDIVLCSGSPQIFGRALLQIPRYACLNVHASILPKYRGPCPLFYTLHCGDDEGGVCVHRMEATIDSGCVYARTTFPINGKDSLFSLSDRAAAVAGSAVESGIRKCVRGDCADRSPGADRYWSLPDRRTWRAFFEAGKRVA